MNSLSEFLTDYTFEIWQVEKDKDLPRALTLWDAIVYAYVDVIGDMPKLPEEVLSYELLYDSISKGMNKREIAKEAGINVSVVSELLEIYKLR